MAGVLRTPTTATPRAVSASAHESFFRTDVTKASADAMAATTVEDGPHLDAATLTPIRTSSPWIRR
jgi:hypothetical protein